MAHSCRHVLTMSYFIVNDTMQRSEYNPRLLGAVHSCNSSKCKIQMVQHLYGDNFTLTLANHDVNWLITIALRNNKPNSLRVKLTVRRNGQLRFCTNRGADVDDVSSVASTCVPFHSAAHEVESARLLSIYNENLLALLDEDELMIPVHWHLKRKNTLRATYDRSNLNQVVPGSCTIENENGQRIPLETFNVSLGLLHFLNGKKPSCLYGTLSIGKNEVESRNPAFVPSIVSSGMSTIVRPEHWDSNSDTRSDTHHVIGPKMFVPLCQCLDKQLIAEVPNTPENRARTIPILGPCDGVVNWKLVELDMSCITSDMNLSQHMVQNIFHKIRQRHQQQLEQHQSKAKKRHNVYLIFRFIVSETMEYIVRLGVKAEPFSITIRKRKSANGLWISAHHYTKPEDLQKFTLNMLLSPKVKVLVCSVNSAFRSVKTFRLDAQHTDILSEKSSIPTLEPVETMALADPMVEGIEPIGPIEGDDGMSVTSSIEMDQTDQTVEIHEPVAMPYACLFRNFGSNMGQGELKQRHEVLNTIINDPTLQHIRFAPVVVQQKEDFVRIGQRLLEPKSLGSVLIERDGSSNGYYDQWLLFVMCMLYQSLSSNERLYDLVHDDPANVQITTEDVLQMFQRDVCGVNGCLFVFIGGLRVMRQLFRQYKTVDDIMAAYDMKPDSIAHTKTLQIFIKLVNVVQTCEERLVQLFTHLPDMFSPSAPETYGMMCQQVVGLIQNMTEGFYLQQWKIIHTLIHHMVKICSLVMDNHHGAPIYGESTSGKTTMINQLYVLQTWLYIHQNIGITAFPKDGLHKIKTLLDYRGSGQQLKDDIQTFASKLSQAQMEELTTLSKDMATENEHNTYSATTLKRSGFLSIQNYLDSTTKFPTIFTRSLPPWTYQVVLRPVETIREMTERDGDLAKYIASNQDIERILLERSSRCLPITCLEHHPDMHLSTMKTNEIMSRMLVMMSMIHGVNFDIDDECLTLKMPFPQVIEEVRIGATSIGLHDIQGSRDACQYIQVPTQPFEHSPLAVIVASQAGSLRETGLFIYNNMHVVKKAIQQFAETGNMSEHPFSILLVCNVQKEVDVQYKGFSAYNSHVRKRHDDAARKWCFLLVRELITVAKDILPDIEPNFDRTCLDYLLQHGCIIPVVACLGATTTLCHLLETSTLTPERIDVLADTWKMSGLALILDFIHIRQPYVRALQWQNVLKENQSMIQELRREQEQLIPLRMLPGEREQLSKKLNTKIMTKNAQSILMPMSKSQEFALSEYSYQDILESFLQDLFVQCHLEKLVKEMVPPSWRFFTTRRSTFMDLPRGSQIIGLLLNGYDFKSSWKSDQRLVYMQCSEKCKHLLSDWTVRILASREYGNYLEKLDQGIQQISIHISSFIFSIVPHLQSPHRQHQFHSVIRHTMLKYIIRCWDTNGEGDLTDERVVFGLVKNCFESSKKHVLTSIFTSKTMDFSTNLLDVSRNVFQQILGKTIRTMKVVLISQLPKYLVGMMDEIKKDILGASNSVIMAEDVLMGAIQGLELFNETINKAIQRQMGDHEKRWIRPQLYVLRDKILGCRTSDVQLEPLEPDLMGSDPHNDIYVEPFDPTPIHEMQQLVEAFISPGMVKITIQSKTMDCNAVFNDVEHGLWKTLARMMNMESVDTCRAKLKLLSNIMPRFNKRCTSIKTNTHSTDLTSVLLNMHILAQCFEYYVLIQLDDKIVGNVGCSGILPNDSGCIGYTIHLRYVESASIDETWKTTPKGPKRPRDDIMEI